MNVARYDMFEKFDRRNLVVGEGVNFLRDEERKYSMENGRREVEFEIWRMKELKRVKEEVVRSGEERKNT